MWRTGNGGGSHSSLLVLSPYTSSCTPWTILYLIKEFEWTCLRHSLLGIFALHGCSNHAGNRHCWVPFIILVRALLVLFGEAGLKNSFHSKDWHFEELWRCGGHLRDKECNSQKMFYHVYFSTVYFVREPRKCNNNNSSSFA